jgi:hypothetical protein
VIEVCFCGRTGEVTERIPVVDARGPGLQCPSCGHVDRLLVLSEKARLELWAEAKEREARAVPDAPELRGEHSR